MIIQALNEVFDVIYIKQVNEESRILHCCIPEKKEEYTMLHFKNPETVKKLLPLFYPLQENRAYKDYKGCFSDKEELYVVFYKRKGVLLKELLTENALSLEQRILIGKRVLEKMLLWNLPEFMVCQLICADKILIRNEEIEFNYEWDMSIDIQPGMEMVNQRMMYFLTELFQKEAGYSISPRLTKLLDDLKQNIPEDYFAIYEAYIGLYEVLPGDAAHYVSGFGKIKKTLAALIRKGEGVIKIVLFFTAYLIALFFLINEIKKQDAKEEEPEEIIYETIGTLRIE